MLGRGIEYAGETQQTPYATFGSPEFVPDPHRSEVSTLSQVWQATVDANPAAPACIDASTGETWTRAGLRAQVAVWRSTHCAGQSLERRRVAVFEPNGIEWWRVFLGLIEEGAVPALLDSTEPVERRRELAQALGASWLWSERKLEALPARPRERQPDACLLKVTSGSTGIPKSYLFTHAQMLADGRQICASMAIEPRDLNLAIIPLGHSYALGNIVVPLLDQGTACVVAASPLPQALASDCERWRPTVFPAVPALLRALVRAEVSREKLASVRLVISAGAALPPEIARAFHETFGLLVHGFYGASETGGICYDRTGDATLASRSVGTPIDGVSLEFTRGDRFRVRSAAVLGKGVHRMPDLGRLNESGELELLGRAGRTLKIAGRRLDLNEVETVTRTLAGVREAYAAAGRRADTVAIAVCTTRSAAELKTELRARLAPWKVPDQWLVLPEFPLTARGKTDTKRLRALLSE